MEFRKHRERRYKHLLSAPFIYMMIFPSVIFDISMEIYHRVCFPLYGIEYARRYEYIRIDRHKIQSLSFSEKINCMYCGYVNGLMAYAVRIAGDTERYWCGIKHQSTKNYHEPSHHSEFIEYDSLVSNP